MKKKLIPRRKRCRPHVEPLEQRLAPLNLLGLGFDAAILAGFTRSAAAEVSQSTTDEPNSDNGPSTPGNSALLEDPDLDVIFRVLEELESRAGRTANDQNLRTGEAAFGAVSSVSYRPMNLPELPLPANSTRSDNGVGQSSIAASPSSVQFSPSSAPGALGMSALAGAAQSVSRKNGAVVKNDLVALVANSLKKGGFVSESLKTNSSPSCSGTTPTGESFKLVSPETEIIVPHQRQEPSSDNWFTGELVVHLEPGASSENLAGQHGFTHVFAYPNLDRNLNLWKLDESKKSGGFISSYMKNPESHSNALLSSRSICDAYPAYMSRLEGTSFPNDPIFPSEWHLFNTGQSGGTAGLDANVPAAWDLGFTGKGVTIGVVDDGVQSGHPDLSAHYDALASYDFFGTDGTTSADDDDDPSPTIGDGVCDSTAECHGTAVAGVAAGIGNNNAGVIGAAPDAKIGALRLIAGNGVLSSLSIADALRYSTVRSSGSQFDGKRIDIYNNSWGPSSPVMNDFGTFYQSAIIESTTNGRGGLGSIYTFSAGNSRADDGNVNYYTGSHNDRRVIAVAAVPHDGTVSEYSNPGASLLISGPSNGRGEGIATTDLITTDINSASRSDTPGYTRSNYTNTFGGTSSAAPLVSGVIALMLEANPRLTYRDVQHILVESASLQGLAAASLATFNANQSGRPFSHDFGFGVVNAGGAVNLATSWQRVGPELLVDSGTIAVNQSLPDNTQRTNTFNVTPNIRVETVEVVLNATHTFRGDVEVLLEHAGTTTTTSRLAEVRDNDGGDDFSNYVFTTRAHWGESSSGNWTLKVRDGATLDTGNWQNWSLRIYGTEISGDKAPRVVQVEIPPSQLMEGQISSFQVQFNQPINSSTLVTADDIFMTRIVGGSSTAVALGAASVVSGTNNTVFSVNLTTAQTAAANYRVTVGPNVNGTNGVQMDQNANSADGNTSFSQYYEMGSRLMFSKTTAAPFSGTTLSEGAFTSLSALTVPSRTLTNLDVEDLNLVFEIYHSIPSRDLRLRLDSPSRSNDIISETNASNSAGDPTSSIWTNGYWDTVLDDESSNSAIDATVNPNAYHYADSYKSKSGVPLSLFDGDPSAGNWRLWVNDTNVDGHAPRFNDYILVIEPVLVNPDIRIDSVTNFDGDNLIDVAYTISRDNVTSNFTLGVYKSGDPGFDVNSDTSTGTFSVTATNCVGGSGCWTIGAHVAQLNASLFPTPSFALNVPMYAVVVADPNWEVLDQDRANNTGILKGVTKANGNALWIAGDPNARNTVTITNSDVTFTNLNSGNPIAFTNTNVDYVYANMGMLNDSVTASSVTNWNILAILAEGADTYTGGSMIDVIQGGPGNDNMSGNGGNDRIFGATGTDVISGGNGTDLLSADDGLAQSVDLGSDDASDTIAVGGTEFNDHIRVWDPDNNPAAIGTTLSASIVSPVNPVGFNATTVQSVLFSNVGASDRLIVGTGPGNDRIQLQFETPNFGTGVGNTIVGLNAIIGAGAGNDVIFAGRGNDTIAGDQFRFATVGAGDGDDTIDARDGIAGNDVLYGAGGTDTLDSDTGDTENDG